MCGRTVLSPSWRITSVITCVSYPRFMFSCRLIRLRSCYAAYQLPRTNGSVHVSTRRECCSCRSAGAHIMCHHFRTQLYLNSLLALLPSQAIHEEHGCSTALSSRARRTALCRNVSELAYSKIRVPNFDTAAKVKLHDR